MDKLLDLIDYLSWKGPSTLAKGEFLEWDLTDVLTLRYGDGLGETDEVVIAPTGALWRITSRIHNFDSVDEAVFPPRWVAGEFLNISDMAEGWERAVDVINQESG